MKNYLLLPLVLFLSACGARYATKSEYFDGYQGKPALVKDSLERQHRGKIHVYFVEKVNGKPVENSNAKSSAASYGQGAVLTAVKTKREVPASEVNLKIVGKTLHAAPIQAMFGTNYRVEANITIVAQPEEVYTVRGWLSDNYSALWLEDSSGKKVSKLFEKVKDDSVNVEEYRNKIKSISYKTDNLTEQQKFLRLEPGESEKFLIKTFGEPDDIEEFGSNFFTGRKAYKVYSYSKLGTVRVSHVGTIMSVQPTLHGDSFSKDKIEESMSTNQGTIIQQLAKKYYKANLSDVEILDVFATKIWAEYKTEDRYMVDGVSWLCKIIGKSGNSRYRELLSAVSAQATETKLRKYARLSLEQLKDEPVTQFKGR